MATSRPVSTIDKNGKPGRPTLVSNQARRVIAAVLAADLPLSGMIPEAIPEKALKVYAARLSVDIRDRLAECDLHIVPGSIMRELSLLCGEAGPSTSSSQSQTTQKT